jgi:hypothetical protein
MSTEYQICITGVGCPTMTTAATRRGSGALQGWGTYLDWNVVTEGQTPPILGVGEESRATWPTKLKIGMSSSSVLVVHERLGQQKLIERLRLVNSFHELTTVRSCYGGCRKSDHSCTDVYQEKLRSVTGRVSGRWFSPLDRVRELWIAVLKHSLAVWTRGEITRLPERRTCV